MSEQKVYAFLARSAFRKWRRPAILHHSLLVPAARVAGKSWFPRSFLRAPLMNPNPFLGVVFHWLGGLASGSFYVPFRGVKRWAWETYWLVGGFFSWIIAPWTLAVFMTADLIQVLREAPSSS